MQGPIRSKRNSVESPRTRRALEVTSLRSEAPYEVIGSRVFDPLFENESPPAWPRRVFRIARSNATTETDSPRSSLTARVTHICIPKVAGIPARPSYDHIVPPLEKETVEKAALRAIKHLFPSAAVAEAAPGLVYCVQPRARDFELNLKSGGSILWRPGVKRPASIALGLPREKRNFRFKVERGLVRAADSYRSARSPARLYRDRPGMRPIVQFRFRFSTTAPLGPESVDRIRQALLSLEDSSILGNQ